MADGNARKFVQGGLSMTNHTVPWAAAEMHGVVLVFTGGSEYLLTLNGWMFN